LNDSRAMHTFVFADLAGFTAMTEAHGDEVAAEAAGEFFSSARDLAGKYGGEEVKTIGDAVLLRVPDATQATLLAVRMIAEIGGRHGALRVRVGMHTGPAVTRDGDWFGAAVNLASRVSAAADVGEVLMTAATRELMSDPGDLVIRPRGRRRFKNVAEPVEVFALALANQPAAVGLPVDPVCRMAVKPGPGAERRSYRGREHLFCSRECAVVFDRHPERYGGRAGNGLDLLVSDGARERVAERLKRAYRRGRLDADGLERRVELVYAAQTRGELRAVTHDLPRSRRGTHGPFSMVARLVSRLVTAPGRMLRRRRRNRS
jgi:adenylate cyclase